MNVYKILGYLNPISCNGAPVITVINRNRKVCGIFPDLTIESFNIINISDLKTKKSFIPEKKICFISENEYSYISLEGKIFTDNEFAMLEIIKSDLIKLDKNHVQREMLEELIVLETIKFKRNSINELLQLNERFSYLRLIATPRLKCNNKPAIRLILQHCKNGNFKTDYKKNFYSNEIDNNNDLKRMQKQFNNSLSNLSHRYKDECIQKFKLLLSA